MQIYCLVTLGDDQKKVILKLGEISFFTMF